MKIKECLHTAATKTRDFFQKPATQKALKIAGIALAIILGVTAFVALSIFVPVAAGALLAVAGLALTGLCIAALVRTLTLARRKRPQQVIVVNAD
jgi:small-conductance mechanosensitive channel